jgi:hypothetical protein
MKRFTIYQALITFAIVCGAIFITETFAISHAISTDVQMLPCQNCVPIPHNLHYEGPEENPDEGDLLKVEGISNDTAYLVYYH